MTVNGLPLHPLLVHAIVVGLPLAALALVLHAIWPAARARLGIVTPLAALVVLIFVPITQKAGEVLLASLPGLNLSEHQERGEALLPWSIALFVISLAVWAFHGPMMTVLQRNGEVKQKTLITVILIVASLAVAIGSVVQVVLTGDSGARAVWGQG